MCLVRFLAVQISNVITINIVSATRITMRKSPLLEEDVRFVDTVTPSSLPLPLASSSAVVGLIVDEGVLVNGTIVNTKSEYRRALSARMASTASSNDSPPAKSLVGATNITSTHWVG